MDDLMTAVDGLMQAIGLRNSRDEGMGGRKARTVDCTIRVEY